MTTHAESKRFGNQEAAERADTAHDKRVEHAQKEEACREGVGECLNHLFALEALLLESLVVGAHTLDEHLLLVLGRPTGLCGRVRKEDEDDNWDGSAWVEKCALLGARLTGTSERDEGDGDMQPLPRLELAVLNVIEAVLLR